MAKTKILRPYNALLVLFLLAAACSPEHRDSVAPSPAATADILPAGDVMWLKKNAIPLWTAEPGQAMDDLQPLKSMIGDAELVALGEATHGTHEFFAMKHRLLEFLVQEMGFRVFAIEANWPEANLINAYIHTGKGDPEQLLSGLRFWTWDTQEVLDMIIWMRRYNENTPASKQIDFYGFDMQFDTMARRNVLEYLGTVDPFAADEASNDYSCYPQASAECQEKLQRVFDWLAGHQAEYAAESSAHAFAYALQSARVVIQYRAFASANQDFSLRDRFMAENVQWILKEAGPNPKVALWAHNLHVGTLGDPLHPTMGDQLRKALGARMVSVGFLFGEGSFNSYGATNLETFRVDKPPIDTYEFLFQSAGLPLFMLDLRRIGPASQASAWLTQPHRFRNIGAQYDPNDPQAGFWTAALSKTFDVVIYFQETSPSRLLPN